MSQESSQDGPSERSPLEPVCSHEPMEPAKCSEQMGLAQSVRWPHRENSFGLPAWLPATDRAAASTWSWDLLKLALDFRSVGWRGQAPNSTLRTTGDKRAGEVAEWTV